MVLLGNFLKLGLGLNPPQDVGSENDAALVRVDKAAHGVPSYAANIERLHYTVKRARSIIEGRDTSVAVPHSELHSILTKIEDLEQQVKALLHEDSAAPAPTSPAPKLGPGSPPTPGQKYGSGGAGDRDCDAENLLYDLGARAVVDADGQVSGHPLFRRNANCPMESAVNGKNPANASGPGDSSKASANGGEGKANPNSPSAGDASPNNHKAAGSVGTDPSSSSGEKQKAKGESVKGTAALDGPAGDAGTGLPRVVSATVETVETKTVPVNGELVTTTITRTITRLSTVTVVRHHQATDTAGQETSDGADRAVEKPQDGTGDGVGEPKGPQHVPTAPSAGSYAQFSNDTFKFSNSTAAGNASPVGTQVGSQVGTQVEDKKTANVGVDEKASNRTFTGKTGDPKQISNEPVQGIEKAGNTTAPQDAVSVTVTPEGSASDTAAADKVVGTSSQQLANLTTANESKETATANTAVNNSGETATSNTAANNSGETATSNTAANESKETAAANTTADEKSSSSVPDPASNPATDTVNTNERIQVITVVPIPAKVASASPVTAAPAATPDMARDKAEPEPVPRAETGFKTVRVPESK